MTTTVPYAIGAEVHSQDDTYGELKRVVIDPLALRVTHLVVGGHHDEDRLVPVDLVDGQATDAEHIRLRCDSAAVRQLEPAEETEYLPGSSDQLGYQPEQLVTLPVYGMGVGGVGMIPGPEPVQLEPSTVVHERVPGDQVQIRHGDRVEATDGEIGRVQGLVVDPQDHGVTHVLLKEGHLWGRKTVAIPIGEVSWSAGSVTVRLSKAELAELPSVDVHALR
ncbi:PRC-barrel domain-containing protein [Kitasatospora sp. NBC_01287]|uniref:PRC-barrel domain-containing protein n=1 Tax=Kitasatospora sp. NBC_01287 TaxID=2903573 RepID=UPI00225B39A3|nr:PRC-barrel domain-containing protein [Kitasatospora sp. NBC_01287]MCX4744629.1 PRC-barrel domain-containing protein [Kitasatospora sp. NBC_01287]